MSEEKNTAVAVVETIKEPVKPVEDKEARLTLADVIRTKAQSRAFKDLIAMFGECRPHDTKATIDFGKKWLKPLGAHMDGRGNWRLRIGDDSKVIWSSHIDTVDWNEGAKRVILNHSTGVLHLSSKDVTSSCLGADCTTGVWIMREMALAKVPGLYIWHEGEEAGGLGSSWIAKNDKELLKTFDAAIAFDRKGFDNIITEQAGGQCCSNEFAKALALQLPLTGFKPDPTGTFTDTANYADYIPECTNLSVGYFGQHGKTETQNMIFAMMMRGAMIRFNEAKLVIKRKPGEGKRTYASYYGMGYGGGNYMDWGYGDSYPASKGTAPDHHRDFIMVGDKVRVLSGAAGRGAFAGDIGRIGKVTQVRYSGPRVVDILLDSGDRIDSLEAIYVERIKVAKPATEVGYFLIGDEVKIKTGAGYTLACTSGGNTAANTVGKQGIVIAAVGWTLDIELTDGRKVWGLDRSHVSLVKAVRIASRADTPVKQEKPKDTTRCGGLCGGKCKGYCASAQTLAAERHTRKVAKLKAAADALFQKQKEDDERNAPREARSILEFVRNYPDQTADLIEGWGLTIDDLYDAYPDTL